MRARLLLFAAAFVLALAALLPMRVAIDWLELEERGISAREAQGTVWIGALRDTRFGPLPLGDLHAGLDGLPLLLGRARVALERGEPGPPLAGAATVTGGGFGLHDIQGRIAGGALFAPLPITALDLTDVSAHFRDGRCASAEGRVRAELAGELGGIALPGGLSGNARCDGEALLVPLAGQSGLERVDLRIFPDGRWIAQAAAGGVDQRLEGRF